MLSLCAPGGRRAVCSSVTACAVAAFGTVLLASSSARAGCDPWDICCRWPCTPGCPNVICNTSCQQYNYCGCCALSSTPTCCYDHGPTDRQCVQRCGGEPPPSPIPPEQDESCPWAGTWCCDDIAVDGISKDCCIKVSYDYENDVVLFDYKTYDLATKDCCEYLDPVFMWWTGEVYEKATKTCCWNGPQPGGGGECCGDPPNAGYNPATQCCCDDEEVTDRCGCTDCPGTISQAWYDITDNLPIDPVTGKPLGCGSTDWGPETLYTDECGHSITVSCTGGQYVTNYGGTCIWDCGLNTWKYKEITRVGCPTQISATFHRTTDPCHSRESEGCIDLGTCDKYDWLDTTNIICPDPPTTQPTTQCCASTKDPERDPNANCEQTGRCVNLPCQ